MSRRDKIGTPGHFRNVPVGIHGGCIVATLIALFKVGCLGDLGVTVRSVDRQYWTRA
jgi:hypothetical protein